jgi:hypothetical protein
MSKSHATWAPLFPGFYGTIFEYDRESEDIEYYNEENDIELGYDDFDFDYSDYRNRICRAFVNRLEKEISELIPIKIEYQSISSPREYNFNNDSINVKVTVNLQNLIKLISDRKQAAVQYFKERYTSRSGFISYHSNKIYDWLNREYVMECPDHRIGALLDCLCAIEWDLEQTDLLGWVDSEIWVGYTVKETAQ